MDFLETLSRVTSFLDERNVPWALVGGLALSAYGGARTTLDLDLAVDGSVQEELIRFMESEGFEIRRFFTRHGLLERFHELEETL